LQLSQSVHGRSCHGDDCNGEHAKAITDLGGRN
jgi:hypothetical protein